MTTAGYKSVIDLLRHAGRPIDLHFAEGMPDLLSGGSLAPPAKVSHGSQLQSLWMIPTAAVS